MEHQKNKEYQMGATFLPGFDDYYMPPEPVDVVSPAPQRITPEVPGQIQDKVHALELDSTEIQRPESQAFAQQQQQAQAPQPQAPNSCPKPPIQQQTHTPQHHTPPAQPQHQHDFIPKPSPILGGLSPPHPSPPTFAPSVAVPDEPHFSPFPKLHNRTPNIPPTHEEREATLENSRLTVLTSSDAEMQLYWAEDALRHTDSCAGYEQHIEQFDNQRPSTPPTERQIRTDAVNVVSFLAEQGHPKAEFLKGMWLEFGKFGYAQNKPEAFRAYKRATAKGYARAEYRMGLQYESTAEPMKALQHYKAGEAQGDSASCYRVGMMSLLGQLGQAQDFANGVRLVQFAANSADENAPQGAYVFGMMLSGELAQVKIPEHFLPLNFTRAKEYIEKAAFLGFAKAQLKMGSAYELCSLGCAFDPAFALHYMSLAARQGEPEAEMAISKWFLCGYDGVFKKNNELAYKYAERAAASGLDTGEFAMGYFHEVGIHVPVSIEKAREWYEKAAKHGNKDAPDRMNALASSGAQRLTTSDHENVALGRIRSQYGSKRGPRPERFQNPMQSLPQISEQPGLSHTPQPQPRPFTTPRPPQQFSVTQQHGPGRTITPYPVDDRSVNKTPYPTEDQRYQVHSRPAPNSAFFVADDRLSSVAADGRMPPMPYRAGHGASHAQGPGPYRQGGPQGRPMTASSNPNSRPPPLRQHDPRMQPGNYRPPNSRMDSAPPGPIRGHERPGMIGSLPPRQTNPPGQHRPDPSPPTRMGQTPTPSSQQPMDIGFSAPVDMRADQRNRHQGPSGVKTHPTNNPNGTSGPAKTTPPPRTYSRPPPTAAPQSAPTPVLGGNTVHAPPAPKPPKGPQTFEEMGVPSVKQDHDCIVM